MTTVSYPDVLDEIIDRLDVQPTLAAYSNALKYLDLAMEGQWNRGYDAGLEDRDVA